MKLSNREKTLLFAMVVMIAAVGLFFLAKTSLGKASAMSDELSALESKIDYADLTLAVTGRGETLAELKAEIGELENEFYPLMTNSQTDAVVTGIATGFSLTPNALTIDTPLRAAAVPYAPGFEGAPPAEDGGHVYYTSAFLSCVGSYDDFVAMLDYLADRPALRVTGFSIGNPDDETSHFTVRLMIYMYSE